MEAVCAPFQFALSTRAGTDCVGHTIRAMTDVDPECTVLSIDGVGAYDHATEQFPDQTSPSPEPPRLAPHLSGPHTHEPPLVCGKTMQVLDIRSGKRRAESRVTEDARLLPIRLRTIRLRPAGRNRIGRSRNWPKSKLIGRNRTDGVRSVSFSLSFFSFILTFSFTFLLFFLVLTHLTLRFVFVLFLFSSHLTLHFVFVLFLFSSPKT